VEDVLTFQDSSSNSPLYSHHIGMYTGKDNKLGALSFLTEHNVVPAGQEGLESAQPPNDLSRGLRDCSIFLAGMSSPVTRVLRRKSLDSVSIFIVAENQFENVFLLGHYNSEDKTVKEIKRGKISRG
jgi:hypothetical protein